MERYFTVTSQAHSTDVPNAFLNTVMLLQDREEHLEQ